MKKEKNNQFSSYEDDIMSLSNKEKEIQDLYSDVINGQEEIEDEDYSQIDLDELDAESTDIENETPEIEEYELDGIEMYNPDLEESIKDKKKQKKNKKNKQEENVEKEEAQIEEPLTDIIPLEDTEEMAEIENIKHDLELTDYEESEEEPKRSKKSKMKPNTIINIIFSILMLLIILAAIDIVMIVKYEKGPYFAIPVKTYDDGGSKIYMGLGYKVIKYNQIQGRIDTEVGTWALKYNIEPIYLDAIDLAIEVNNNEAATYEKYYKKFMAIKGTIKSIDMESNKIVMGYIDEGGKYTIDIECSMQTEAVELEQLDLTKEITVIGIMNNYKYKSKDNDATIKLKNCFAGQE